MIIKSDAFAEIRTQNKLSIKAMRQKFLSDILENFDLLCCMFLKYKKLVCHVVLS